MRARTRRTPEDPGSAVRREPEAHPLLALQHAIGNRATAVALARDPVRDAAGTITAHRFDVGTHISAAVAAEAKRVAAAGAITTAQLTSIRTNTLAADSTIDDNERLFMAGLLDAANARTMAAASVSPGDRIEFPAASITPARRAAAEAAGRAAMPPDVARLLDQVAAAALALDFTTAWARLADADRAAVAGIARLTGTFAPVAAGAVTVATGAGLGTAALLSGMLNAASDGTAGDLAMAAVVIAIAYSESHPLLGDLTTGRVRVDEVPAGSMPGGAGHLADYVTIGQGSGAKGDTIYLPSTFDIANAYHWSVVVHELQHAIDDKAGAGATVQWLDRAQTELAAYRAQGRSLMAELRADPSATVQIGAQWTDMVLLGMTLESRGDAAAANLLIEGVNAAAPASHQVPTAALTRVLGLSTAQLERLALSAISAAYGTTPVPVDGFAGSSIIDWLNRI